MSRTFELQTIYISEHSFKRLAAIIFEYSGISLDKSKLELVKNRLRKRLRALKLQSFQEYCDYVSSCEGESEIPHMIDAISTNITAFFRERAHYRFLYETALPNLAKQFQQEYRQLKIWSAACSTGEEPYSIAMVTHDLLEKTAIEVKILATDISNKALARATEALYEREHTEDIPQHYRRKYVIEAAEGDYGISGDIVNLITFRRLNLVRKNYPFGQFDIIFCRNVMIYFDENIQKQLVENLKDHLTAGGYLFLGHAESLSGKVSGFKHMAPAVYQKEA